MTIIKYAPLEGSGAARRDRLPYRRDVRRRGPPPGPPTPTRL
jgi:hypothetical protein